MIVGSGMLAKAFRSRYELSDRVLIFASGTANSLETDPAEFRRESDLLVRKRVEHPEALVVYFSSCSLTDPDRTQTPYVQHKIAIETMLERRTEPYLILRLPVVIGRSNLSKTLPFFIRDQIMNGREFEVWKNAIRYPIDIDDAVGIGSSIIDDELLHNRCIDVALRAYPVPEIVHEMERLLGRRGIARNVERGGHYALDLSIARRRAESLGIPQDERYLQRVLAKYFVPLADGARMMRAKSR